jgi:hypothetical protein
MVAGTWLYPRIGSLASADEGMFLLSSGVMYLIYLIIGIVAGSMMGPRFAKGKNKYGYLFPLLLFLLIGIAPVLYYYLPQMPFPVIGQSMDQFTYLSWSFVGIYSNLIFR